MAKPNIKTINDPEWFNRQRILINMCKNVMKITERQVDLIADMIQDHGQAVIDEANDYVDADKYRSLDFPAFVMGTKMAVIKRLEGRISDPMTLALGDIIPDTHPGGYGSVYSTGRCNEQVAELFMDMMVDGVVEERIGELISYDIELYSWLPDEAEDDVDLDRLLDGLAVMMSGHGIRGDTRAKAKEFLAAVAADTINEVVHEK